MRILRTFSRFVPGLILECASTWAPGARVEGTVYLIQLLLPAFLSQGDEAASNPVTQTRRELIEAFGGLTAYVRTPALGVWTSPEGERAHDEVVMVEVVAERFDRTWWREYTQRLARRFGQEAIHVRALQVDLLDPDSA
jgi:hypothetical protein